MIHHFLCFIMMEKKEFILIPIIPQITRGSLTANFHIIQQKTNKPVNKESIITGTGRPRAGSCNRPRYQPQFRELSRLGAGQ